MCSERGTLQEVLRWQDAANELLTYGHSENALVLLEQEIEDKVRWDRDLRDTIKQTARGKNVNMEYLNDMREMKNANFKNLEAYRRMRDSLYAAEFTK